MCFLLVVLLSFYIPQTKQTKEYEVVVSDLNIPWGFTFLPDNSMLITEKEGKVIHFKNGKKNISLVCQKLKYKVKVV